MNSTPPAALQLCPFSAELEAELAARFEVVRWFELDEPTRTAWLAAHAARVRAVVTGGHVGCPSDLMTALPDLGIVAINGVGTDKVDLALAKSRGVRVSNTPDVLTEDVADLAVGLVIGLLRQIPAADAYVRAGDWLKGDRPPGRKVSGRRFGVVGLGRIGAAIAARLAPFGPVAYTGPRPKDAPYPFVAEVTELARNSDVLVLACPANASTRRMIDAEVLKALGPTGYLVNVARGSVVDEAALVAAIEAGGIAGAALDVFEDEPRVPAALRESARTVLTPHIASASVETRANMAALVLANLDALAAGAEPPTAVV
jgi:lactate dehydrogenase-like 2-hydroxyacid dehydrogenase